ncbi:MAG: hypothetical protein U0166_02095 [Acidobacteriota bacterium]
MRVLPATLGDGLALSPVERHRWIFTLMDAELLVARHAPEETDLEVRLPRIRESVPWAARYVLFPRWVEATPAPSADRGGLHLEGRADAFADRVAPAAELQPIDRVAPARVVTTRRILAGALVRVEGRAGDAWVVATRDGRLLAAAPLVGARAVFREPVDCGAGAAIDIAVERRAGAPKVAAAGGALATETIELAAMPRTFRRFQSGRFVLWGDAAPARLPATGDGSFPRGAAAIPLLLALGLAMTRPLRSACAGLPSLRVGLAWFFGSGCYAVVAFLFGWAGVPWTLVPLACVVVAGALAAAPVASVAPGAPPPAGDWGRWVRLALTATAAVAIGAAATVAALYPRDRWDSFSFWGCKAKEVLRHGTLSERFLSRSYPHQSYPLAGPHLEALVYRLSGGISDPAVALLGPATVAFTGLALHGALRRRGACAVLASLVAAALCLAPRVGEEAAGTLMDVHVAGFALSGVVLFDLAGPSIALRVVSGALIGLAGFAKNDGLPYSVGAVAASLLLTPRIRSLAATAAGIAIPLGPWLLFRTLHHLETDIVNERVVGAMTAARALHQLPIVVRGMLPYAFGVTGGAGGPGFGGGFVLVVFGLLVALARRDADPLHALAAVAFVLTLGVYCMLPPERLFAYTSYIATTGFRILTQAYPIGLYLTGRQLARYS